MSQFCPQRAWHSAPGPSRPSRNEDGRSARVWKKARMASLSPRSAGLRAVRPCAHAVHTHPLTARALAAVCPQSASMCLQALGTQGWALALSRNSRWEEGTLTPAQGQASPACTTHGLGRPRRTGVRLTAGALGRGVYLQAWLRAPKAQWASCLLCVCGAVLNAGALRGGGPPDTMHTSEIVLLIWSPCVFVTLCMERWVP